MRLTMDTLEAAKQLAKRVIVASYGLKRATAENFDVSDVDLDHGDAAIGEATPDVHVFAAFAFVFVSLATVYGLSKRDQLDLITALQRTMP